MHSKTGWLVFGLRLAFIIAVLLGMLLMIDQSREYGLATIGLLALATGTVSAVWYVLSHIWWLRRHPDEELSEEVRAMTAGAVGVALPVVSLIAFDLWRHNSEWSTIVLGASHYVLVTLLVGAVVGGVAGHGLTD